MLFFKVTNATRGCSFLFCSEKKRTKETLLKGERAYDSVAERLGLKD